MGSQNCTRDPVDTLYEAIKGGITAFQFREKGRNALKGDAKITLGKKLRAICKENNIPFFINDDVELIHVLEADGIHVGQEDTFVTDIRREFPNLFIGLSVSNEEELKKSPIHIVDYVGAGPIFATKTKEDAKNAVSPSWISTLRERYPKLPIVGIGGITIENANQVLHAGANGVAVISEITKSNNIQKTVRLL